MKQYNNNSQEKGSNANAAPASVIGSPFHNPYTFVPFPDKSVNRDKPVPITIDEFDSKERVTGILELEVKTLSPLLTQESEPYKDDNNHKSYHALSIGNDIIVPATSVRGTLRTLMTNLSGGTLGYMDTSMYLCQGRDAHIGADVSHKDRKVFLGEVIEPGDSQRSGKIRLGETQLVLETALKAIPGCTVDSFRPKNQNIEAIAIWIDSPQAPTSFLKCKDEWHLWKVKLSGKPVNTKGKKKEGAFKPSNIIITIPEILWSEYQGRNKHGFRPELKKGDLIWLEPEDPDAITITSAEQINSLQWARWGRHGVALKNVLPPNVLPDSMQSDGRVDSVTELFGQVPMEGNTSAAGPFSARIRPHNLIFINGKNAIDSNITLAPLSSPHPGCIGFYRDGDPDQISQKSPLKGYKIYRNTEERGSSAPWNYNVQGVYETNGKLKLPEQQRVNKTVDLLKENQMGKLRISFRALTGAELALLLTACSVDWKMGGGKPLGLGHCRVTSARVISEDGIEMYKITRDTDERMKIPEELQEYISGIGERVKLYHTSQIPVKKLRYPRAAKSNENDIRLEGLQWFSRHVAPKKTSKEGQGSIGIQTLWTRGALQQAAKGKTQIKAQILPKLDSNNKNSDTLYGYDCYPEDTGESIDKKTLIGKLEIFEQVRHGGSGVRGTNTSQNRETRQEQRETRTPTPSFPAIAFTKDNAGEFVYKALANPTLRQDYYGEIISTLKQLGITENSGNKWPERFEALKKKAGY